MNCIGEGNRTTPIMANYMYGPQSQVVMNKINDIRCDRFFVVALVGSARLAKSAEIRGDNSIVFR